MTLISLLLVLAIERVTVKTEIWRSETWLEPYLERLQGKGWLYAENQYWQVYLAVALPVLVFWGVYQWLDSTLLILILNVVLLVIALGCPHVREQFKGYLQASNRGDFAARDLYAQQLSYDADSKYSFGQHMVWLNFRYYFSLSCWFLLLGGTGVALYLSARFVEQAAPNAANRHVASRIMFILDWIPSRLAACGFLLVGHFTGGIQVFLSYIFDVTAQPKDIICRTAKACEEVEVDTTDCTEEPCTLLRLAKRNMVLLLAVTAVLTLGGWIL